MDFFLDAVMNNRECTIIEKFYKNRKGMEMTQEALLPWLKTLDLFKEAPVWKVPVYLIQGRRDLAVPSELVVLYFKAIQAPKKELIWFESSAHMPVYEEPEKCCNVMVNTVLQENRK